MLQSRQNNALHGVGKPDQDTDPNYFVTNVSITH